MYSIENNIDLVICKKILSMEIFSSAIAPCEIMLNMTFENGVKDEARGSFVEVGRGNAVPTFTVNAKDTGDGRKAAYFTDTALNIWYFAGNHLSVCAS